MAETTMQSLTGTRAAVIREAATSNASEHRRNRHESDPRHVFALTGRGALRRQAHSSLGSYRAGADHRYRLDRSRRAGPGERKRR